MMYKDRGDVYTVYTKSMVLTQPECATLTIFLTDHEGANISCLMVVGGSLQDGYKNLFLEC